MSSMILHRQQGEPPKLHFWRICHLVEPPAPPLAPLALKHCAANTDMLLSLSLV